MAQYSQRLRFRLLGISRELGYLADEVQQRQAYRTVAKSLQGFHWWVPYIGFPIVLGVVFPFSVRRLSSALPISQFMPAWIFDTVVCVALGLLTGYGWVRLTRRKFQRAFWNHLCSIGVPTCRHCGYNLTGLAEPRCPECGQPFRDEAALPQA